MATPKANPAKTTATKAAPAAKKPAAPKAAAAKKPAAAKKAAPKTAKTSKVGLEERYRMIEVAAYFLAERNDFKGNPVEYWSAAEIQISKLLTR